MFNQKLNHYLSENPDYLGFSYAAPAIRPQDIHNCGTTINKYKKINENNNNGLPLQTWSSKNVAVEAFGMRPIVNSNEYFNAIRKYLASLIYTDSIPLKQSKMSSGNYKLLVDYGEEPLSSFLHMLNLEVTNKINMYFAKSSENIKIFNEYNPMCEGFVITDIDIQTYQSKENNNYFFHKVIFSAFNTTRYNTVTFKGQLFQDITGIITEWNEKIKEVEASKDLKPPSEKTSIILLSMLDVLNNTICDIGQDNDCEFKAYNSEDTSVSYLNWLQPETFTDNAITNDGNYNQNGQIKIVDNGPSNINDLINKYK